MMGNLGKKAVSAIRLPAVWIPLLLLTTFTLIFRFTDADLVILRQFYVNNPSGNSFLDHWPMMQVYPWKALYDWGVYPGWILGCTGLLVWIVSFWRPKLERWRDEGLFYFLVLLLGPGLLVNGILKPYWGRPRPNAIVSFGGQREFLPVWQWGQGQDEASFPSGHASMGFYLMVPAFVYYRRRPRLALGFLLFGLFSGGFIGLARIVAGGHFPSDVLWAGGFVYFTAMLVSLPFKFGQETERPKKPSLPSGAG
jgi:membrane-associated PAP2 superfamily phosphatase